jgi:hypothetical protein
MACSTCGKKRPQVNNQSYRSPVVITNRNPQKITSVRGVVKSPPKPSQPVQEIPPQEGS